MFVLQYYCIEKERENKGAGNYFLLGCRGEALANKKPLKKQNRVLRYYGYAINAKGV